MKRTTKAGPSQNYLRSSDDSDEKAVLLKTPAEHVSSGELVGVDESDASCGGVIVLQCLVLVAGEVPRLGLRVSGRFVEVVQFSCLCHRFFIAGDGDDTGDGLLCVDALFIRLGSLDGDTNNTSELAKMLCEVSKGRLQFIAWVRTSLKTVHSPSLPSPLWGVSQASRAGGGIPPGEAVSTLKVM